MQISADLQRVLNETQTGLNGIFGDRLESLLLFGSCARGEQTEESDIDVMALVNLSKRELAQYRRRVSDFTSALDLEYGVLLSVKLQDTETFRQYETTLPFFKNVVKEGINII